MFSLLSSEFILILVWIGFVAIVARFFKVTKKESVIGYDGEVERYYWLFAFVAFLPIIIMTANRSIYLFDTGSYYDRFNHMPVGLGEIGDYLEKYTKDKGFSIFSIIIKTYITSDAKLYFFIIALIQGLCLVGVYRKYSSQYVLSISLFILSTEYIAWMYNGLRQFLAACIIFAATSLLLKKKYTKYVPIILLIVFASYFHQSALIVIPFVFLIQGKAWNKKTLLFILLTLLAILFVGEFTNLLDSALSDTQYSNVVTDYSSNGLGGTHPLRVLLYSIPTIIAFLGRKKIQTTKDTIINLCVNASLISTGLYVISMFTSGMFLGRLPIYMSLYNYILLPWEIDHIIPEKYRNIAYIILILIYCVFYYFQMSITWGLF